MIDSKVLAVDVGGSHVKVLVSGGDERRQFESGTQLTAQQMVDGVLGLPDDWSYDVVSVGIPAPVHGGRHLPFRKATYEDYVGEHGRKRLGKKKWQAAVREAIEQLAAALEPDDVVLGGGNVKRLDELPPNVRLGANENAFGGGFRLWDQPA